MTSPLYLPHLGPACPANLQQGGLGSLGQSGCMPATPVQSVRAPCVVAAVSPWQRACRPGRPATPLHPHPPRSGRHREHRGPHATTLPHATRRPSVPLGAARRATSRPTAAEAAMHCDALVVTSWPPHPRPHCSEWAGRGGAHRGRDEGLVGHHAGRNRATAICALRLALRRCVRRGPCASARAAKLGEAPRSTEEHRDDGPAVAHARRHQAPRLARVATSPSWQMAAQACRAKQPNPQAILSRRWRSAAAATSTEYSEYSECSVTAAPPLGLWPGIPWHAAGLRWAALGGSDERGRLVRVAARSARPCGACHTVFTSPAQSPRPDRRRLGHSCFHGSLLIRESAFQAATLASPSPSSQNSLSPVKFCM